MSQSGALSWAQVSATCRENTRTISRIKASGRTPCLCDWIKRGVDRFNPEANVSLAAILTSSIEAAPAEGFDIGETDLAPSPPVIVSAASILAPS